jgi:hypothetical protein
MCLNAISQEYPNDKDVIMLTNFYWAAKPSTKYIVAMYVQYKQFSTSTNFSNLKDDLQILKNLIPVDKPWYLPSQFVLCQIPGVRITLEILNHPSRSTLQESCSSSSLQNLQIWELWQCWWDRTNQLVVLQYPRNHKQNHKVCKNFQAPNAMYFYGFQREEPHKFSRCFSFDIENGMSPSKLLKEKSLNKKVKFE